MINDTETLEHMHAINHRNIGILRGADILIDGVHIGNVDMDTEDEQLFYSAPLRKWVHDYYEGDLSALDTRLKTLISPP